MNWKMKLIGIVALVVLGWVAYHFLFVGFTAQQKLERTTFFTKLKGIERVIVWSDGNGLVKEWVTDATIDIQGSAIYFIDNNGQPVIVGPGFYSETKKSIQKTAK